MRYYPAFIDLRDRPCLVVGGGAVAARKSAALLRAGALVDVIAPEVSPELADAGEYRTIHQRDFEDDDIAGYQLIVAATDDEELNRRVSVLAREMNILVNVVDRPELCTYIVPSVVDRSPVVVAISSGGSAPVLARTLRARLESLIPASYGKLAELMGSYRERLPDLLPDEADRRRFWEWVVHGPVAELMFSGRAGRAREELDRGLAARHDERAGTGEVSLVGAGPGDPDLLTFRALRLMQQADVILHDRLVSDEVLDLCRRDASRIYVGKRRSEHSMQQEDINSLLVSLAREGNRVVRLKGGDPFIFGRGGEEIEGLAEAGIPFQVVPGITAASGCATYAGIPLTHRDHASSCLFVTGHLRDDGIDLDWDSMVKPDQTVVIFMGLTGLPVICDRLVEAGMDPETPAALVERGTTADQRVVTGTVASLQGLVDAAGVRAPTIIIIGSVVLLHDSLAWYEPDG